MALHKIADQSVVGAYDFLKSSFIFLEVGDFTASHARLFGGLDDGRSHNGEQTTVKGLGEDVILAESKTGSAVGLGNFLRYRLLS